MIAWQIGYRLRSDARPQGGATGIEPGGLVVLSRPLIAIALANVLVVQAEGQMSTV